MHRAREAGDHRQQCRAGLGGHGNVRGALRRWWTRAHRGVDSPRTNRASARHRRSHSVPLLGSRPPHHGRDSQRQRRQRARRMIVLLFTGGTISMRHDPASGGAVPSLSGRDILALAPAIEKIAEIEIIDFGAYPGPHMTMDRMWELRNTIAEQLERTEVQGVV